MFLHNLASFIDLVDGQMGQWETDFSPVQCNKVAAIIKQSVALGGYLTRFWTGT